MLPDAKQFLTWPALLLASASGYLFLWAIGKYVYHVCPACAVNNLEQANPQLPQPAMMLMVALGLHCTMDALGIAFGDNLLGAGMERKRAITWARGVESMTIVGGVIGFYLANSVLLRLQVKGWHTNTNQLLSSIARHDSSHPQCDYLMRLP